MTIINNNSSSSSSSSSSIIVTIISPGHDGPGGARPAPPGGRPAASVPAAACPPITGPGQTGFLQEGGKSLTFFIICFKCAHVATCCHILHTFSHESWLGGIPALLRRTRLSWTRLEAVELKLMWPRAKHGLGDSTYQGGQQHAVAFHAPTPRSAPCSTPLKRVRNSYGVSPPPPLQWHTARCVYLRGIQDEMMSCVLRRRLPYIHTLNCL